MRRGLSPRDWPGQTRRGRLAHLELPANSRWAVAALDGAADRGRLQFRGEPRGQARVLGARKKVQHRVVEHVRVLLQELLGRVDHLPGVVLDGKVHLIARRLFVAWVGAVPLVELGDQRLVRSARKRALVVQ